jgi:glycosyltransferase involved in cell wall biosynthesis
LKKLKNQFTPLIPVLDKKLDWVIITQQRQIFQTPPHHSIRNVMQNAPLVSVIIPCYNQAKYIKEAVESVLNQTLQNFEIIIVNDGSKDNTAQLLQASNFPKTKIITTENRGVSSARNTGIKAAQGKYILPLDADDKIGNTYLQKACEILEKNLDVGIIYCQAKIFGKRNEIWNLPKYTLHGMLAGNIIFNAGVFRKSTWEKTRGYDESLTLWEDWDFWISILETGLIPHKIEEILFYYRKHGESSTRKLKRENDELKIARKKQAFTKIVKNHLKFYTDNIDALIDKIYAQPKRKSLLKKIINIFRQA